MKRSWEKSQNSPIAGVRGSLTFPGGSRYPQLIKKNKGSLLDISFVFSLRVPVPRACFFFSSLHGKKKDQRDDSPRTRRNCWFVTRFPRISRRWRIYGRSPGSIFLKHWSPFHRHELFRVALARLHWIGFPADHRYSCSVARFCDFQIGSAEFAWFIFRFVTS